jgi:hypothetical protein
MSVRWRRCEESAISIFSIVKLQLQTPKKYATSILLESCPSWEACNPLMWSRWSEVLAGQLNVDALEEVREEKGMLVSIY